MPSRLPDGDVGAKIREIRGRLEMTQAQFAEALGVPGSAAQISKWEGGATASHDTLERIATLAKVPAAIFYEPDATPQPLTIQQAAELRDVLRRVVEDAGAALRVVERAVRGGEERGAGGR